MYGLEYTKPQISPSAQADTHLQWQADNYKYHTAHTGWPTSSYKLITTSTMQNGYKLTTASTIQNQWIVQCDSPVSEVTTYFYSQNSVGVVVVVVSRTYTSTFHTKIHKSGMGVMLVVVEVDEWRWWQEVGSTHTSTNTHALVLVPRHVLNNAAF